MDPKKIRHKQDVAARRASVAEMWARRITQRDMARTLNVSEPTISRDIAWLLDQWRAEAVRKVDDVKARELADLDAMERDIAMALVPHHGNTISLRERARLTDTRLRIKERRAKLLGLDAPTRQEISGPDEAPLFGDAESVRTHLTSLIDAAAERLAHAVDQASSPPTR
jgi:hypothetical protein